jgi:hypothetical protein
VVGEILRTRPRAYCDGSEEHDGEKQLEELHVALVIVEALVALPRAVRSMTTARRAREGKHVLVRGNPWSP